MVTVIGLAKVCLVTDTYTDNPPTPGRTWTDDEVIHVVALAYAAGRRHAGAEDVAETVGCWLEHAEPRATRAEHVRRRLAEMEWHAARVADKLGRWPGYRYDGGPVDWETGLPVLQLAVAA